LRSSPHKWKIAQLLFLEKNMHVPFALTAEQRTQLQHWLAKKLGFSEWVSLETTERLDVQHLSNIIRANARFLKATQAASDH
jgi:hypothetical protein